MRDILKSNDAVVLSFAEAVLREAGISADIADRHMSIVEGSIGIFPRRLLVATEDVLRARRLLAEAGLAEWLADEDA
ncbi:MAG: DUF2007 domain-containing protein [Hyphomicrobiaceae bacterium]